jgi:hypothetical protein
MEKNGPADVPPGSEQRMDLRLSDQLDPSRITPRTQVVLREVFHLDPVVPGGMVAPQVDALTAAALGMFLGGMGATCAMQPVTGGSGPLSCPRCRNMQERADRCARCGLDIPGEGKARFARARSMLTPPPSRPVPGRGPDRPLSPPVASSRPAASAGPVDWNRSWFVREMRRTAFNTLLAFGSASALMGWLASRAFAGGYSKTGVLLALTSFVCALPSLLDFIGLLSPRLHPMVHQLGRYGDAREMAEDVERQRRTGLFTFMNFQMAGPWVIGRRSLSVRIFPAREVVAMGIIPKGITSKHSSGIYRVTVTTIYPDRFCGLNLFLSDGSTFDFHMGELKESQYRQLFDAARRITAISGAELSMSSREVYSRWNDPKQRLVMLNEHIDRQRR